MDKTLDTAEIVHFNLLAIIGRYKEHREELRQQAIVESSFGDDDCDCEGEHSMDFPTGNHDGPKLIFDTKSKRFTRIERETSFGGYDSRCVITIPQHEG